MLNFYSLCETNATFNLLAVYHSFIVLVFTVPSQFSTVYEFSRAQGHIPDIHHATSKSVHLNLSFPLLSGHSVALNLVAGDKSVSQLGIYQFHSYFLLGL